MNTYREALIVEARKALRSRVPAMSAVAMSLGPLVGGFFMVILTDPERAKRLGLIGDKARLVGTADWPAFFGMLSQMISIGGGIVFAFLTAWVFGREFADRCMRQLLAIPTSRSAIVAAKFTTVAVWALLLSAFVFLLGLMVGVLVQLPGFEWAAAVGAARHAATSAVLTIALLTPVALLACAGRGYLAPLAFASFMVFVSQIAAATGWGPWVPWSVPPLYSGVAGPMRESLTSFSYTLVAFTSAAGLAATFVWWRLADHVT